MVPRMSVVRRPSQGSPVSFKRRPRKKAAPSSEPCRICSDRKATRLLPTPTRHRASRQKPLINYHPTMKPVELVERALRNSSKTRDTILDPFGGSGTTLIACQKTGRQARLIELEPKYCDVIIRRWQEFTGQEAKLEADGRSYSEISRERTPVAA